MLHVENAVQRQNIIFDPEGSFLHFLAILNTVDVRLQFARFSEQTEGIPLHKVHELAHLMREVFDTLLQNVAVLIFVLTNFQEQLGDTSLVLFDGFRKQRLELKHQELHQFEIHVAHFVITAQTAYHTVFAQANVHRVAMLLNEHVVHLFGDESIGNLIREQVLHHIEVGVKEAQYGPWFCFYHSCQVFARG